LNQNEVYYYERERERVALRNLKISQKPKNVATEDVIGEIGDFSF